LLQTTTSKCCKFQTKKRGCHGLRCTRDASARTVGARTASGFGVAAADCWKKTTNRCTRDASAKTVGVRTVSGFGVAAADYLRKTSKAGASVKTVGVRTVSGFGVVVAG